MGFNRRKMEDQRRQAAGYWLLWVRCPACRTTNAIDLRDPISKNHSDPGSRSHFEKSYGSHLPTPMPSS
jgi:hypothetical protein